MTPEHIDQVRTATALILQKGTGVQTEKYGIDKVVPPMIFAGTHEARPADTDDGITITFSWWAAVSTNNANKQGDLDTILLAMKATLDDHPRLGTDLAIDAAWLGWSDYGDLTIGTKQLWAARTEVEVLFS